MSTKNALILAGDGINCEIETAEAAREAGFETRITHVNDLLAQKGSALDQTQFLVLPGGFSFGDELGSGKILALKLKHGLGESLIRYIDRGGLVLGICNGFQVLTRLGIFGSGVVLAQNEQGHFLNCWVGMQITGKSVFTDELASQGKTRLELPIRHGEGRLLFKNATDAEKAKQSGQVVLQYDTPINGAWENAAGLSAHEGRVLGLMPHPEAFWSAELHPWGADRAVPLGLELFRAAYRAL